MRLLTTGRALFATLSQFSLAEAVVPSHRSVLRRCNPQGPEHLLCDWAEQPCNMGCIRGKLPHCHRQVPLGCLAKLPGNRLVDYPLRWSVRTI